MEKAQRGISAAIAVLLTAVLAMVIAAPAHAASFIDVDEQTPHAEDITWLADHKISEGYPDKTFRPLTPVFRQDMAAFLYRLAGEPEYTPTEADANSFTDVNSQTPHAKEIWWLASTGISKGYPDGSFGPMKEVARCDMAAFLRRLAVYMGDSDAQAWTPGGISAFTDVSNGTSHAEDIFWLAYTKVSAGYPDCTFRPFATVVRQDMAAFLHRLDTHVASHAKPEPPASDAYELGTYAGYSYVNIKDGSGFEESEKVCDVAGQTDTMTIFYRGEGIYLYDYTGSASTLQIPARINGVPVISVELQKTFATTQQAPNLQRVDATTASDLVFMQVDMDHITSIAANGLPELKFFHSSAAALKDLACKSCPKLRSIYVKNTQLESIDLSGLPELMLLNLSGNQLASLDVSANPKLFELECDMNNIQDLNALKQWLAQSGHSGTIEPQRQAAAKPQAGTWNGYDYLLVSEACGFQKYDSITFGSDDASMTYYEPGVYITSAPRDATSLTLPAAIDGQPLVAARLADGTTKTALERVDASAATSLCELAIWNTNLDELSLGTLPKLEILNISSSDLKGIDLSGCANLQFLLITYCKLEHIDLTSVPMLSQLSVNHNNLGSLDISPCKKLTHLNCEDNRITNTSLLETWLAQPGHSGTIAPQKNPDSTSEKVTSNGFTYYNVKTDSILTWGDKVGTDDDGESISYRGSGIYIVNTSKQGALAVPASLDGLPVVTLSLPASNKGVTSIDARSASSLQDIRVLSPQVASLAASGLPMLSSIHVMNTQMTSLDCSGCDQLFSVYAGFNEISTANLVGCAKLNNLFLQGNELTSFDVSPFPALEMLYIQDNHIADTSQLEAWLAQPGHQGNVKQQRL